MARIVVPRNQQAEMQRLHPKPVYSRVINLTIQVPVGLGSEDYAVSAPIGNRVWLLGVNLYVMNLSVDIVCSGFIYISTGMETKADAEMIAVKWDPVIREYGGPKPCFYYSGNRDKFHWDMMQFYEGSGRRFGIAGFSTSIYEVMRCWVSFEISEG